MFTDYRVVIIFKLSYTLQQLITVKYPYLKRMSQEGNLYFLKKKA